MNGVILFGAGMFEKFNILLSVVIFFIFEHFSKHFPILNVFV